MAPIKQSVPKNKNYPVTTPITVGIGASAGGHEPLKHIFSTIPSDSDLSFVVIMHIPEEGPSHLTDLIRHYTSLEVVTAEDDILLRPNVVYLIPPGKNLTMSKGRLRLHNLNKEGRVHHPINLFFSSLADELGECAIAVILSGFGVDGSDGVKKIKERGGIVLIQDPETAINPPMPRNAIATGAVDLVLSAEKIANKLTELAGGYHFPSQLCLTTTLDEDLHALFALLRTRTGHDFSSYKKNTVLRRIDKRMITNEVRELREYIAILQEKPEEAQALCQELLIGVTSFFRDPEAFELLRSDVIPALFANRGFEEPIRIWHPCCATGEEAYTVAMLIREHLENTNSQACVQIFATDLDEIAVAKARAGLYSCNIESDVDNKLLEKYFTRNNDHWQVTKQLREMIVFAHHSIIKDPPFSRLDLLVCRNFLIYLNPDIQNRLVQLFHQVLRPRGYLFLGSAETVGFHNDLFTPFDKKWKIFIRQEGEHRADAFFPFSGFGQRPSRTSNSIRMSETDKLAPVVLAEKLLIERYIPARVIVNEKNEVVYFSNRAGTYLLTPEGEPTRDILKIAREDLRPALRVALYKAFTDKTENIFRGIRMISDGQETTINIIVAPLKAPPPANEKALVIFEPAPSAVVPFLMSEGESSGEDESQDLLVCQLEEQLRVTGEQLQAMTEQLAAANDGFLMTNEELMATNEELQSANEELQATNEELETSKEELQALNEELITVNTELQEKMRELDQSNSDLENLLASSDIATVFLNRQLFIKRFSPAMSRIFNLIPTDIGRPFGHLNGTIDLSELPCDATLVIEKLIPIEREVNSSGEGQSFIMRVLPYRTTEGLVDGIVVTLVDITQRKRMEEELKRSENRLGLFIDQAPASLAMFDTEMRYLSVSRRWVYDFSLGDRNLLGMSHYDILPQVPERWREEHRRGLAGEAVLAEADPFVRSDGSERWFRREIRPWTDSKGEIGGIVIFTEDITNIKKAEEVLRRYELLAGQSRDIILFAQRDDFKILDANTAALKAYGYSHDELLGMTVKDLRIPDVAELLSNQMEEADTHGILFETIHRRKDGTTFPAEVSSQGADLGGKRILLSMVRDITERKQAEDAMNQAAELRRLALEAAGLGAWKYNFTTREVFWDKQSRNLWDIKNGDQINYNEVISQIHPEDRDIVDKAFNQALSGVNEGKFHREFRIQRSDGSERWIQSHGRVYMEGKEPVRFVGVNRDITEDKQSELTRAKLAAIVESSDDAIIAMDLDGTLSSWNKGAQRLYGYFAEEVIDRPITILIPPEMQNEENLILRRLSKGEHINHFETVRLTKDGQKIDVSLTASPITDIRGHIIGISKIARDITERKRAEEALTESRTKLKAALASMTDAVFICDSSGVFIEFNEAFAVFHRFENKDVCFSNRNECSCVLEFFTTDGELLPHELWPVSRAIRGETVSNAEFALRRKDTGETWVGSYSFSPIRDTNGTIVGAVTVARDITELKQNAEAKIKIEAQLQQAQKMEAVGQLAGGIAHDFNNMLGVILGHAELAMEEIGAEHPLFLDLKEITNAARRSADITRQLLAFARKQTIIPKIIDLNTAVEGVLKMLRRLIGEDIDLVWIPGFDLWPVKIDPSQVDQILANLCINARDAISGVGKITVETENRAFEKEYCENNMYLKAGDYVMLTLTDSGCGMSKEVLNRIFEPFFTTKRVGEGTGLGLSTVYGIVKQNKSYINVYSNPGQGTTFKVYLPKYWSKTELIETEEMSSMPIEGGHETILLVEDELSIMNMTSAMLQRLGYSVIAVGTPGEAIKAVEEFGDKIHLLITDVIMPEMNGKELAKELLVKKSGMKCLFMSGYTADIFTRQGVLEEGMCFIQKPFTKKELANKVRRVLKRFD